MSVKAGLTGGRCPGGRQAFGALGPGEAHGGVLQCEGLPVGVVPAAARARRVTETGFPSVRVMTAALTRGCRHGHAHSNSRVAAEPAAHPPKTARGLPFRLEGTIGGPFGPNGQAEAVV
jgi:hypothetical protein